MDSTIRSAAFVHTYGRGSSFQVSIHPRMSRLSWRVDVCAPRLSFFVVGSENQRSTRFWPRSAGRCEVQNEPRVGEQPALDDGGLVRGGVIEHEVHLKLGRDLPLPRLQELL